MLKRLLCKNVRLLALILGATLHVASLCADEPIQENMQSQPSPAPTPLDVACDRLRVVARQIKDPDMRTVVKEALRRAKAVRTAGDQATVEMAQKAIHTIQKVIAYIERKAEHASSSSSSRKCDLCGEINDVDADFKACCEDIKRELTEILVFLDHQFPCDATIPINHVPIIVSHSGKYCVTQDLLYSGSGAAITVTADNVQINFHNYSLTLANSNAQGILCQNVDEFLLENDAIKGQALFSSPTSAAVHLVNVKKATINNILTENTTKGLWIEGSEDVFVQDCHFHSHLGTTAINGAGAGVWIAGSQGVTIETSVFEGADFNPLTQRSFGLHVEGASKNITLTDSTLTNWASTLHLLNVTGALVDHCLVIASDVTPLNMLQAGGTSSNTANDLIIRNSQFVRKSLTPNPTFDGLLFLHGSGALLENIIVDTVINEITGQFQPAAIHIGCMVGQCEETPISYSNMLAKACVVRSPAPGEGAGLYVESGSKITFDVSQFSGYFYNVLLGNVDFSIEPPDVFAVADDCCIKNSTSSNSKRAFAIFSGSNNSVINCHATNSDEFGIFVSLIASNTRLEGNRVYANEFGISDDSTTTMTYFNTSCNNDTTNCSLTVFPQQVPGASPEQVGSNVCCQDPGQN